MEKTTFFCDRSLPSALLSINDGYQERLELDIAPTEQDVILSKPWLTQHNPNIDWTTKANLSSGPQIRL
jgi:hypothetical protein